MKRRLTALLLVLLCLPLTACQKQQNLYSATWFDLFDTVAIVQGYADSQDSWNAQTQAMYSDLQRYNELFDIYHHYDGVINLYDVNARAAAAPVQVSDELYAFCAGVKTPLTLPPTARRTSPQVRCCACGTTRGKATPCPPDADAIAAALAHIDVEDLVLDDAAQTVYFADPEMALDVGAVGKGYAVEQTARAAQARGLTSALLNIGGNVRAIGTKPGGKPWTAGVENPWGDDPAYIQAVELADGDSLVISGDYQRYFEYDGVRYAHLIDLTTGYPARYVSSVAVLARADTGGLADALSTGLFCLPEETGQALAAQNHYAVLWMHPDETTSRSADWPQ
ncbi:FAD:protein FMN transferase [Gemmiger formicilis]|nr:FAD:protein FMN transferase [Gemmiger formicilis]